MNLRVSGIGAVPKLVGLDPGQGTSVEAARLKTGSCAFRTADGLARFETSFFRRDVLPAAARVLGPAVLLQADSTTVVPPGWSASVHPTGNLLLTKEGSA